VHYNSPTRGLHALALHKPDNNVAPGQVRHLPHEGGTRSSRCRAGISNNLGVGLPDNR
jgi:hypothetical protein